MLAFEFDEGGNPMGLGVVRWVGLIAERTRRDFISHGSCTHLLPLARGEAAGATAEARTGSAAAGPKAASAWGWLTRAGKSAWLTRISARLPGTDRLVQ